MADRNVLIVEVALDLKQPLETLAGNLQRSPASIVNQALEELREAVERVAPGERERRPLGLERELVLARVGDVLADTLVAAALEVDHGRQAREVVRGLHLERLKAVRVELERELADAVVGRQPPGTVRVFAGLVY